MIYSMKLNGMLHYFYFILWIPSYYGYYSYSSVDLVILDYLRVDDWDSAQVDVMRLQEQDKVIFYQPYAPKRLEKIKRLFVVDIKDECMRVVAKTIFQG